MFVVQLAVLWTLISEILLDVKQQQALKFQLGHCIHRPGSSSVTLRHELNIHSIVLWSEYSWNKKDIEIFVSSL